MVGWVGLVRAGWGITNNERGSHFSERGRYLTLGATTTPRGQDSKRICGLDWPGNVALEQCETSGFQLEAPVGFLLAP